MGVAGARAARADHRPHDRRLDRVGRPAVSVHAACAAVRSHGSVSDIAWARTSRWRTILASLWPDIANVGTIRVHGTAAQAHLLAGWLRSRLDRPDIALEHVDAERLEGIDTRRRAGGVPAGRPAAAERRALRRARPLHARPGLRSGGASRPRSSSSTASCTRPFVDTSCSSGLAAPPSGAPVRPPASSTTIATAA